MIKEVYKFLFKSDSIWSWAVSLALALLFIKFIFFPGMSLIFQNPMPLVVIESSSMHHEASVFGNLLFLPSAVNYWYDARRAWYDDNNISREEISQWPWQTGMNKGDIILVSRIGIDNFKVGDVIIFEAGQRNPVIHRIISIEENEANGTRIFSTKGDNNAAQLPVETAITEEQILGKALFRIPKLGWAKLIFVDILSRLF